MFERYVKNGGKLQDIMSQVNHPNRKGHDLVANALLTWFSRPSPRPLPQRDEQRDTDMILFAR